MPTPDLSRFFSNPDRDVFALRGLPEEVVAYLFARYSRSTLPLREDLARMVEAEGLGVLIGDGNAPDDAPDAFGALQERARTFAEKYVLGYGHGSVAEHGTVHLALENVSILASKQVEDARLASYTEKSTRYVAFDPERVYVPAGVQTDPRLHSLYTSATTALVNAYVAWTPDTLARVQQLTPRRDKQTENGYNAACRATVFDILRCLLPAAVRTNIGVTANARTLEGMVTKLLSSPLPEARELGAAMKREAQLIVPTLLKYADFNAYRAQIGGPGEAEPLPSPPLKREGAGFSYSPAPLGEGVGGRGSVTLLHHDEGADERLAASILYPHAHHSMTELLGRVREMSQAEREAVVDTYLSQRGKHDAPGRALERLTVTMELTMDYGAWRDVQRHRMATFAMQTLAPHLGFYSPPELVRFGRHAEFDALTAQAAEAFGALTDAGLGMEAGYVLPLATRVRALVTWNLREVAHFVELRSARQGHPSYRTVAQDVYRCIADVYPLVARYLRPDMKHYDLTRE